jgi:GDP-L-fucose synthase
MPANLYGPGDNYDPASSHVLAALVRRFVEARRWGLQEVTLWGTGQALREFLHVADVARACVDLMEVDHGFDLVNVGSGEEIRIADLAGLVAEAAGYRGRTVWDRARPDGTPRKLLDSSRIRSLGWSPTWALRQGVAEACSLFGEAHGVIC